MQVGFYFDQTRCDGCFACIVACKDWNDVDAGPASWRRVITIEKGKYPDLFVAFLSIACYHCAEPACVDACPFGAIQLDPEGNPLKCDLCGGAPMCAQYCPVEAIEWVKKYSVGENAGMKLDKDGGIDIYIAAQKPKGVPEENWLPINRKDEDIGAIMRIYVPDLEKMKTWEAPKAERVK